MSLRPYIYKLSIRSVHNPRVRIGFRRIRRDARRVLDGFSVCPPNRHSITNRQCRRCTGSASRRCGDHDPTGVSALHRLPDTKHMNGAASSAGALGADDGRTGSDASPNRPHPLARIRRSFQQRDQRPPGGDRRLELQLQRRSPHLPHHPREFVIRLSPGGIGRTSPRMDDSVSFEVVSP